MISIHKVGVPQVWWVRQEHSSFYDTLVWIWCPKAYADWAPNSNECIIKRAMSPSDSSNLWSPYFIDEKGMMNDCKKVRQISCANKTPCKILLTLIYSLILQLFLTYDNQIQMRLNKVFLDIYNLVKLLFPVSHWNGVGCMN